MNHPLPGNPPPTVIDPDYSIHPGVVLSRMLANREMRQSIERIKNLDLELEKKIKR